MNLQEFKAWFEGYTENISTSPTYSQWERIKKRVEEIDGTATPEKIFVDRYINQHPFPWNNHFPNFYTGGVGSAERTASDWNKHHCLNAVANYSASEAFNQLGKIEFENTSA